MAISLGTTDGNWQTGGGTIATLSGATQQAAPTQTTAQVQQTASGFQPTVNPQPQYSTAAGETAVAGSVDPAAAARAAAEAQRSTVRSSISSLIDQALGVYDTLYGNVRGGAAEQRKMLEDRFARETGALTDQFNVELPKIGRAFAGRGAYDSSYRVEGEAEAGKQFQNQLGTMGEELNVEKAKIGQALAGQEAELGSGRGLLEMTRSRLGEVTDLNELSALQNEIQRKIVELQSAAQSTGSQQSYMSKFNELAPSADRMPQLTSTLSNIINGQAPGALKRAVAQQIIGSAGLPKEQEDQLLSQVNAQIG